MGKKSDTKSKIVEYILQNGETSKVELSKELNLSMPTILSSISELIEMNIIQEIGEYHSTGGRKAKTLGINKSFRYSVGINITQNHIAMVLINFSGEVKMQLRKRLKFSTDFEYFLNITEELNSFIENSQKSNFILGVGISLPGIVDKENCMLIKSHALQLENYSLHIFEQIIKYPIYFENDANASIMSENLTKNDTAIYLSLNNTVGGSIFFDGTLFTGKNHRAGEFGHMILKQNGKKCYCGKKGCADAYCSANVLTKSTDGNLDMFMEKVRNKDLQSIQIWNEYLEYLAILISNLRMAYDVDIILGGDVGGILKDYILDLNKNLLKYNLFDNDFSYLKNCKYPKEATAIGVAKYFIRQYIQLI